MEENRESESAKERNASEPNALEQNALAAALVAKDQYRSEQRFRELMEAMPQLTWSATPDGRPNYANRRCVEYTGVEIVGKMGMGWAQTLHTDDKGRVFALWAKSMANKCVFETEYRMRGRDGMYRWFSGRAVPIIDDEGQIALWVGTATDIEERKRLEIFPSDSRAFLEEEVRRRTAELEESNLALKAANEELEAFCYSVSHDLRAPLRGIAGFSQLLLEDYHDKLEASGRQYLGFVRESVQRMGRLIDQLLELSRLTRAEIKRESLDLSKIACRVISDLKKQGTHPDFEFVCQEGLYASGDPALIESVLENLLSNAWKFTSRVARPRIEFGCLQVDDERRFFVRDNGSGFNMVHANKLFTAFQRLHAQNEFPGTGVGLASVRRIISRHGGCVWAESRLGRGSTFFFTLPSLGSGLSTHAPSDFSLRKHSSVVEFVVDSVAGSMTSSQD